MFSIIAIVKTFVLKTAFALAAAATAALAQAPATKAPAPATKAPAAATKAPATAAAKPKPSPTSGAVARGNVMNPASLKETAPETYKVKFTTPKGDFVVQVTRAWAPLGADRFYNLIRSGFFTDAYFFRIVKGFVTQFGIHSNPAVAKAWRAANIADDPVKESNKRGTLSFATAGPNTRTTQIFINLADNARLDGMGFSPFAQVIEGMDVVDKLYDGYGEAPDQGMIQEQGGVYLKKNFPLMDNIKAAVIPPAAPATPAAKPAVTPAKPGVAPTKPAVAAPKPTTGVAPAKPAVAAPKPAAAAKPPATTPKQ